MRDPHHRPTGLARSLLIGFTAACVSLAATAAPDADKSDPLARVFADRALVNALPALSMPTLPNAPALAERMRDRASDVVFSAMTFLGVPYKRGGSTETSGFDCSGFTRHIVESSLGFVLPRRADEQAHAPGLVAVKKDELKPGDLVFFNTLKRTFSHVGIYIGEGRFIHAPRPGGEVRVEEMSLSYWRKRFTGARRVDGIAEAAPVAAAAASAPVTPGH